MKPLVVSWYSWLCLQLHHVHAAGLSQHISSQPVLEDAGIHVKFCDVLPLVERWPEFTFMWPSTVIHTKVNGMHAWCDALPCSVFKLAWRRTNAGQCQLTSICRRLWIVGLVQFIPSPLQDRSECTVTSPMLQTSPQRDKGFIPSHPSKACPLGYGQCWPSSNPEIIHFNKFQLNSIPQWFRSYHCCSPIFFL